MNEGSVQIQPEYADSSSDTASQHSSSLASSSEDSRDSCPNCGHDHPLKHCPYPNTSDGRLQACFECDNTDHPWFRCPRYRIDEAVEFYLVYVARQGLCPVVHNKQLHDLWRNYFPQLDYDIQALTLRRPGPLTTQFMLRMLQDGANDPEIRRQITYEHRSLPWDLSPDVLDCYQLRVKFAVLDPDTRVMSHKVVYTHMKTGKKQKIKFFGPHFFGGSVDEISLLDRHNLKSRDALISERIPYRKDYGSFNPDCSNPWRQSCMRRDCDFILGSAKHCLACGMEEIPGIDTLFTLPRSIGATLEGYGLLAQLSEYWHKLIHKQWVREDIRGGGLLRCVHHPEIYQRAEDLEPIRANTLRKVAEQLDSNPNNTDVTSFHVLEVPECPECFAIETLGLGDYVQRTTPPRDDDSSHGEA